MLADITFSTGLQAAMLSQDSENQLKTLFQDPSEVTRILNWTERNPQCTSISPKIQQVVTVLKSLSFDESDPLTSRVNALAIFPLKPTQEVIDLENMLLNRQASLFTIYRRQTIHKEFEMLIKGYSDAGIVPEADRQFLSLFADNYERNIRLGSTPLHFAILHHRLDAAAFLLEQDSTLLNHADNKGLTPLMLACGIGDEELVFLLLQHDADLFSTFEGGWTALHYATAKGHEKCVELLLKADVDKTLIDKPSARGVTPIICAAKKGLTNTVSLLLRYGAEAASKDHEEYTSLHYAVQKRHVAAAEILLKHNPQLALIPDHHGFNPMCPAIMDGDQDMLEMFNKYHDKIKIPRRHSIATSTPTTHQLAALQLTLPPNRERARTGCPFA